MAEYRIVATLDPSGVTQGKAKVKQDLREIDTAAASTKRGITQAFDPSQFDRSIGGLTARVASLETSLDKVVAASNRVATGLENVGKGGRGAAQGQASMEAATRRVLQAVDQEAAEMARLNALLADAKMLHDRGALSAQNYARVQDLVNQGVRRGTTSLQQQRAGYTQLGFQVQDITQTAALGINPLVILAQQGGQTASALQMALGERGAAGRAAAFFAGPWGSLIIAGVAVLGTLAYKLIETGNEFDNLLDKMKEDARQSELTRQARERFRFTEEGVTKAINDATEARKKSIESQRTAAENANIEAKNNLALEIAIRNTTRARLDDARALLQAQIARATGPTQSADMAALSLGRYQSQITELEVELAKQQSMVASARTELAQSRADLAVEAGKRAADPIAQLNKQYDNEVVAARNAAAATGQVTTALTRQITAIENRRKAALKAHQDDQKAAREEARSGGLTGFITPAAGRVTSGFGPRAAPTRGASTFHRGIDIAAPAGSPVKAAAGGVVIHAGRLGGLGNVVIVDHGGGTITEYGHLSAVLAQRGQRVGQGERIGSVGSTGVSTGPHLHYQVKVGGRYVDPRAGRFRTDDTAVALRAEKEAADRERLAEQQRDFVTGIENQASTRGLAGQEGVQAQIARTLAEFKRRFDREAGPDETRKITAALTDADARETARRFDEAYVAPLRRLQALQGKTGIDREVMNAQLEETARLGRELTPIERQMIENGIREADQLQRRADILADIREPMEDYRRRVEDLNALLATGQITQANYNARIAELGSAARQAVGNVPGVDPATGLPYADLGARINEEARFAQERDTLESHRAQILAMGIDFDKLMEAAHREHVRRMGAIDQARRDQQLNSAQEIAGSLASIAEMSLGKQSAVYKTMFAIEKAIAIARSIVAIQQGIAQAAALPFPANLGAMATVAAATASIIANIQAVKLNLAQGGYVSGPGGPRDDRVPANLSNGEFVVNAAATAQNRALLEAINTGNLNARQRRAGRNMSQVPMSSGGDTLSLSVGDIIVNTGGGPGGVDGREVGREVRAAIVGIVREELIDAKRDGGVLTRGNRSIMAGP